MSKCTNRGNYTSPRHITHGKSHSPLYPIWTEMKQRCYNIHCHAYKNYGGRGISVCDEWKNDFHSFYEWSINNGYVDGLSIDRIDNNGDYSPQNCRWSTAVEQGNNKRNNVFVEYNGERHSMKEWSNITGLTVKTIDSRRRAGWDAHRILCEPIHTSKIRHAKKG